MLKLLGILKLIINYPGFIYTHIYYFRLEVMLISLVTVLTNINPITYAIHMKYWSIPLLTEP